MNKIKKEILYCTLLIVIAAVCLLYPHLNRQSQNDNFMIGTDSYYDVRISQLIKSNPSTFPQHDPLTYENPAVPFSFFHYVLAAWSIFFPINIWSVIICIISIILLWIVLNLFSEWDVHMRLLVCALFIFSPMFLASYATISKISIVFLLILLIFICLLYVPSLNYVLVPFVSLFGLDAFLTIIAIIFILYPYFRKQDNLNILFSYATCSLIGFMLSFVLFTLSGGIIIFRNIFTIDYIEIFFVDFGSFITQSIYGQSLFLFILFVISFFMFWHKKYKRLYIFSALLVLCSVFFPSMMLFSSALIALFAAFLIRKVVQIPWNFNMLKYGTLLLIIIAIIASQTLYAIRLSESRPLSEEIQALTLLGQLPQGTVLSHERNGFFIEFIANKQSFIHMLPKSRQYTSQLNKTNTFLSLTELAPAVRLLKEHNISYIYIDPIMRDGLVWTKEIEGLQLLLTNERGFTRLYSASGYDIYRINYDKLAPELESLT